MLCGAVNPETKTHIARWARPGSATKGLPFWLGFQGALVGAASAGALLIHLLAPPRANLATNGVQAQVAQRVVVIVVLRVPERAIVHHVDGGGV